MVEIYALEEGSRSLPSILIPIDHDDDTAADIAAAKHQQRRQQRRRRSSRSRRSTNKSLLIKELDMSVHSLENYGGGGGIGSTPNIRASNNQTGITLADIKCSVQAAIKSDKEKRHNHHHQQQQQRQQEDEEKQQQSRIHTTASSGTDSGSVSFTASISPSIRDALPSPQPRYRCTPSVDKVQEKSERQARRLKIRNLAELKHSEGSTSSRSLQSYQSTQSARVARQEQKKMLRLKEGKIKKKRSSTETAKTNPVLTPPRTPRTPSSRTRKLSMSRLAHRDVHGGDTPERSSSCCVPKSPARLNQHLRRQEARRRKSHIISCHDDGASVGSASIRSSRSLESRSLRRRAPRRPMSPSVETSHRNNDSNKTRRHSGSRSSRQHLPFQVPITAQDGQKTMSFQVIAASCASNKTANHVTTTNSTSVQAKLAIPSLGGGGDDDGISTAITTTTTTIPSITITTTTTTTASSRRRNSAQFRRTACSTTMMAGISGTTMKPKSPHCPMRRANRRMTFSSSASSSLSLYPRSPKKSTTAVSCCKLLVPSELHQKCSLLYVQDNEYIPRRQRASQSTFSSFEDDYSTWDPDALHPSVDKKSKYKQLLGCNKHDKKPAPAKTVVPTKKETIRHPLPARERMRREAQALRSSQVYSKRTAAISSESQDLTSSVIPQQYHEPAIAEVDSSDNEDTYLEDGRIGIAQKNGSDSPLNDGIDSERVESSSGGGSGESGTLPTRVITAKRNDTETATPSDIIDMNIMPVRNDAETDKNIVVGDIKACTKNLSGHVVVTDGLTCIDAAAQEAVITASVSKDFSLSETFDPIILPEAKENSKASSASEIESVEAMMGELNEKSNDRALPEASTTLVSANGGHPLMLNNCVVAMKRYSDPIEELKAIGADTVGEYENQAVELNKSSFATMGSKFEAVTKLIPEDIPNTRCDISKEEVTDTRGDISKEVVPEDNESKSFNVPKVNSALLLPQTNSRISGNADFLSRSQPSVPQQNATLECPGTPKMSNVSAKGMEVGMIRTAIREGVVYRASDSEDKKRRQAKKQARGKSSRGRSERSSVERREKRAKSRFMSEVEKLMNAKQESWSRQKKARQMRDAGTDAAPAANVKRRLSDQRATSGAALTSSLHLRSDRKRPSNLSRMSSSSRSVLSSSTHSAARRVSRKSSEEQSTRRRRSVSSSVTGKARKVLEGEQRKMRQSSSKPRPVQATQGEHIEPSVSKVKFDDNHFNEDEICTGVAASNGATNIGQEPSDTFHLQSCANPQTPSHSQSSHATLQHFVEDNVVGEVAVDSVVS